MQKTVWQNTNFLLRSCNFNLSWFLKVEKLKVGRKHCFLWVWIKKAVSQYYFYQLPTQQYHKKKKFKVLIFVHDKSFERFWYFPEASFQVALIFLIFFQHFFKDFFWNFFDIFWGVVWLYKTNFSRNEFLCTKSLKCTIGH